MRTPDRLQKIDDELGLAGDHDHPRAERAIRDMFGHPRPQLWRLVIRVGAVFVRAAVGHELRSGFVGMSDLK